MLGLPAAPGWRESACDAWVGPAVRRVAGGSGPAARWERGIAGVAVTPRCPGYRGCWPGTLRSPQPRYPDREGAKVTR